MVQFLTQFRPLKESLDFIIPGFDFLRQPIYLLEEIKLESKQNVNILGSIGPHLHKRRAIIRTESGALYQPDSSSPFQLFVSNFEVPKGATLKF